MGKVEYRMKSLLVFCALMGLGAAQAPMCADCDGRVDNMEQTGCRLFCYLDYNNQALFDLLAFFVRPEYITLDVERYSNVYPLLYAAIEIVERAYVSNDCTSLTDANLQ